MKNTGGHSCIKHTDIKHHWICEAVKTSDIAISYIPTEENVVDLFTKSLPWPQFKKLVRMIGLSNGYHEPLCSCSVATG